MQARKGKEITKMENVMVTNIRSKPMRKGAEEESVLLRQKRRAERKEGEPKRMDRKREEKASYSS